MKFRRTFRWAAILLTLGIVLGSRLRVSHLGRGVPVQPIVHYAVHVVSFALLTVLLINSANSRRVAWLLFLASLSLGYGTEFYEHVKDSYPIEALDVLADTVGACLAMIFWLNRLFPRQLSRRDAGYKSQDVFDRSS